MERALTATYSTEHLETIGDGGGGGIITFEFLPKREQRKQQ